MHFSALLAIEHVVLAFLLHAGSTIHNASDQFVSCVYFSFVDFAFHPSPQTKIGSVRANLKNSYISSTSENWTHVYVNLFTRNSPYYHLLKYLMFLLKHPVYKQYFRYLKYLSLYVRKDVTYTSAGLLRIGQLFCLPVKFYIGVISNCCSMSNIECVSIALFIHHAIRMHHFILSRVTFRALRYFPTLSHKWQDFQKKKKHTE